VGNAEAPVAPEVMEGFRVMGALAEDEQLKALDNSDCVDNSRACRPFSHNAGFTMAEASQFVVLMDDELALELGANIYGSVADVFVNADANKKSISAPGVGNYVTVAKAAALAKAILGAEGVKQTYVQSHGTVWQYGWIPGITTIDHIADDVHQSNLEILTSHKFAGEQGEAYKAVVLNAKGFGGNNATGLVLSPQQTLEMLTVKYGQECIDSYKTRNTPVAQIAKQNDLAACQGQETIRYDFGSEVMDGDSVEMDQQSLKLSAFAQAIDLPTVNPFAEYSK